MVVFQSLIKKIEQGCRFAADEEGYYECGKDVGENGEITYCEGCSAQLSLLKTLQKEVEEVLDKMVINHRCLCNITSARDRKCLRCEMLEEIKSSLEGIGVENG